MGTRITVDPRVMGGKPCIRGMRVTVATIAGLLAGGHSEAEVAELYPYLDAEDLRAAEQWARDTEERAGGRLSAGVAVVSDPMLVLRLTAGELEDLEEALDGYAEERFDSYRMWLKGGSRSEAALALRDFRRVRRLFRTIGKRAVREGTP